MALSQTPTAQITGRITDTSGAVVPAVHIEVVNQATGVKRDIVCNEVGYYVAPLLPPGTYRITAQKEGFRPVTRQGVQLTVEQVAQIDFTMQIGAVNETIEVKGEAALLENATADIGTLVDTKRVQELPLQGRNVYSLVNLIPGARTPVSWKDLPIDMNNDQFVMINGARGTQNEFLLDGVSNTNARAGGPNVFPSPDSIQEFRVETNNYSAEYGRAAGGVFNVVTKSGTNQFHGSAWEFNRNAGMNANDFFSNRAGQKRPPFTFNQFGASVGGKIRRDKTFFFGTWESARERQGSVFVGQVPTALERAGDFTGTRNAAGQPITIYDPLTLHADPSNPANNIRAPFPNNIIPESRLNPVALAYEAYLPMPNAAGTPFTHANNFISAPSQLIDKDTFMTKLDHQFNSDNRLSGSFHYDRSPWNRPNSYGTAGSPTYGPQVFLRRALILDDTLILNPSTVLDLRYGFSRTDNNRTPLSNGFDLTKLGFPAGYAQAVAVPAIPQLTVAGFSGAFSQANLGPATLISEAGIIRSAFDTHTWDASVTKVWGRHNLKAGFEFQLQRINNYQVTGESFSFSQSFTQGPNPTAASGAAGYGYATFLLGIAGGTTNYAPAVAAQVQYWAGYIQDSFRATPSLTLNFGVRYEYQAPRTDRYNQLTNFDFNGTPPLQAAGMNLRGALAFPSTGGLPRGLTDPDRNNFAPRVGFSYQLTPKTVLRGGAGIFYSNVELLADTGGLSGFSSSNSVVTSLDSITPITYFDNPFPNGLILPSGNRQGAATLLGQDISFIQRDGPNPYSAQWNFDVQREMPGGIVVDAAYVGNRGVKLEASRSWNQLPDADLALGSQLRTLVSNPFYGQITQGVLAQPTVALAQLLRPFPQFTNMTATNLPFGNSIYHALQTKLEKRFAAGLTFLFSYSFSKLIDDVSSSFAGEAVGGAPVQDWNNLRAERSISPYDQTHSLAFSYIWEAPIGPGKRFLSNARGVLGKVVEGWQIQGIASYQTGSPLGMSVSNNTTFAQGGGLRPNWTGQSASLGTSATVDHWFDTSQFTQPAIYAFGTAPRAFADLRADSARNLDFTLAKKTTLWEHQAIQFRVECFNIFNTPRFGIPGQTFGTPTFGLVSTQLNAPRVLQLGLKYLF